MPRKLKVKIYKTIIRPVLLYGAEVWTLRRKEERLLETTEMRMLRRIKGVTLRDRQRSDEIRRELGVENITFKARQSRLRWYGHTLRMDERNKVKQIMKIEVRGNRARGRPRLRWMDNIRHDMNACGLEEEDAQNRRRWKNMIKNPDLAQGRRRRIRVIHSTTKHGTS